jgi:hypothetical protein
MYHRSSSIENFALTGKSIFDITRSVCTVSVALPDLMEFQLNQPTRCSNISSLLLDI